MKTSHLIVLLLLAAVAFCAADPKPATPPINGGSTIVYYYISDGQTLIPITREQYEDNLKKQGFPQPPVAGVAGYIGKSASGVPLDSKVEAVPQPVEWIGLLSYTHRQTDQEKAADVARETEWRYSQGMNVVNQFGQPDPPHAADYDMRFDEKIEIGLRFDGMLVWRKAAP